MRSLKTREAADLLSVSPNTLRTWERKFGFPKPLRSPGRHRAYNYGEIVALRDALKRGLSVRFLAGRIAFHRLERWQTSYLSVFAIWAASVVVVLPPLFAFD